MIRMTLAEVAAVVGGTVRDGDPRTAVTGASHDAGRLRPGDLYVCLTGDPAEARAAGAVAVLTDRPGGGPAVVVGAVLPAYRRLASAVTTRLPEAYRIMVIGGGGRAAAARLLGHVLARLGPAVPPRGGPTPAGVCETLLAADDATRFVVTELDAGRGGDIAALLAARPAAAVILGTHHIPEGRPSAGLGRGGTAAAGSGWDGSAPATGGLVEGLPAGAVAVLDADDPATAALAGRTEARVVTFGRHRPARVRAERIVLDGRARARFVLHTPVGSAEVALRLHGEAPVAAALAAAAVALDHTHDVWLIADALGTVDPGPRGAGGLTVVEERPDGVTVLDATGDGTPEVVLAALRTALSVAAGRRRTVAVLTGLGDEDRIREAALRMGIDEVIAAGAQARPGDVVLLAGESVRASG
ncbi:Mur ligase family protein [Actinoplanes sp. RD1]|uniref:Mur ligase family protein n=1 Tax=Actinoplanes sp. RD1 TaxID=3064538 RepID=UPI002740C730|nr:Mur ligase family protein [Actinoplanes sp. RD1]